MYVVKSKGNYNLIIDDINIVINAGEEYFIPDEIFESSVDAKCINELLIVIKKENESIQTNNKLSSNVVRRVNDISFVRVNNEDVQSEGEEVKEDIVEEKENDVDSTINSTINDELIETTSEIKEVPEVKEATEEPKPEKVQKSTNNKDKKNPTKKGTKKSKENVDNKSKSKENTENKRKGRPKKEK